jgi:hypothetical protein
VAVLLPMSALSNYSGYGCEAEMAAFFAESVAFIVRMGCSMATGRAVILNCESGSAIAPVLDNIFRSA